MARQFNIAGPNHPDWHYTVPVLERLPEVMRLVEARLWFVLHAPRQSGKTTAMQVLAEALTATGRYAALYATCEEGAAFRDDPAAASRVLVGNIVAQAQAALAPALQPPAIAGAGVEGREVAALLSAWCAACPLPVVLLLDEIDALQDEALISVLRQLRGLYMQRNRGAAPSTVALIGLRDVRDYKVLSGGSPHLGTASPFNVKARSLTLEAFTREEVAALYAQHTAETGQVFTDDAIDRAWTLTGGQPWLVNALAWELVFGLRFAETIDAPQIEVAKERLVLSRATHLDSLADKLNEPRVRAVIGPILAGAHLPMSVPLADVEYCRDLGLITQGSGPPAIANPIYREVLPRELAYDLGLRMNGIESRRWALPDGRLDLGGLLLAFVTFWKRNGEFMVRDQRWPEAAHQLLLMAFLQRVVNGGGTIEREYGLGRGRIDLLIRWALRTDAWGAVLEHDDHALELKVWRDTSRGDVLAEGLEQLDGYLDRLGPASGTLVLFDARSGAPTGEAWAERGHLATATTPAGRLVRLLTL